MKTHPSVFYVAFGQGISYRNRNENTTGRLWCRDASQVRGPTQEGKTGAWDLELLSLGPVLAHMLDLPCPK